MLALSIRQPYAELILRGIKTVELRSRSTTIIGERFYLYAARVRAKTPIGRTTCGSGRRPMDDLAGQVKLIEPGALLPTGVIVGSAVIEKVTPPDPFDAGALFRWHLANVERAKKFRKPKGHPQPVWFMPF